jgi:hypothetical protein
MHVCMWFRTAILQEEKEREREREREANIVGKKDAVSTAHNYINYNVSIALSIPL